MTIYNIIDTFKYRVLDAKPISDKDLELLELIKEANNIAEDIK